VNLTGSQNIHLLALEKPLPSCRREAIGGGLVSVRTWPLHGGNSTNVSGGHLENSNEALMPLSRREILVEA
jgi:hypothetical protein